MPYWLLGGLRSCPLCCGTPGTRLFAHTTVKVSHVVLELAALIPRVLWMFGAEDPVWQGILPTVGRQAASLASIH